MAVHTTQFEIRKPEVGLFEPVLRVTKEEMDAYEARTEMCIRDRCRSDKARSVTFAMAEPNRII